MNQPPSSTKLRGTSTESRASLAELRSIGPARVNPAASAAEATAARWSRELGIAQPHLAEYQTMSAYLYPDASEERLATIVLLNNLLFLVDDTLGQARPTSGPASPATRHRIDACLEVLHGDDPPSGAAETDPLYRACQWLWQQLRSGTAPTWRDRFHTSMRRHLRVVTVPLDAIVVNGRPDLDRYLELRLRDAGMETSLDLIEYAQEEPLPPEALGDPALQTMRQCITHIGGLTNDLFSYEKEVLRHGSRFNLVAVLMDGHRLPFAEAVRQAIRIINGYTTAFERHYHQLPGPTDPYLRAVGRYAAGMVDVINATYHWQMSTARYRSPTSPFVELTTPPGAPPGAG